MYTPPLGNAKKGEKKTTQQVKNMGFTKAEWAPARSIWAQSPAHHILLLPAHIIPQMIIVKAGVEKEKVFCPSDISRRNGNGTGRGQTLEDLDPPTILSIFSNCRTNSHGGANNPIQKLDISR